MDTARRWSRRKAARPQEILDAALAVFTEKGFDRARMEDIAEAAGVTKGTIYLYFESKEAVFKSLVHESISVRVREVEAALRDSPLPSRELLRLILAIPASLLMTDDPRVAIPKIVLAEAGNFPELAEFYRREVIDHGLAALESLIRRGIERGEFRAVDPAHAAKLCFAPMVLSLAWRTSFAKFDPEPLDYKGLLETHFDVLLDGLAAKEN